MPPVIRETQEPHHDVVLDEKTLRSVGEVDRKKNEVNTGAYEVLCRPGSSVVSDSSSISSDSVYTSPEEVNDEETDDSDTAEELLLKANDRVQIQRLKQDLQALQCIIKEKDEQMNQLTRQLRRATESKCNLVLACTEMEHEKDLVVQRGEKGVKEIRKENMLLLEQRACMEAEFMNELLFLSQKMSDMERRYKNQLLEKDFEMAKLEEQVRRIKMSPPQSVRKH